MNFVMKQALGGKIKSILSTSTRARAHTRTLVVFFFLFSFFLLFLEVLLFPNFRFSLCERALACLHLEFLLHMLQRCGCTLSTVYCNRLVVMQSRTAVARRAFHVPPAYQEALKQVLAFASFLDMLSSHFPPEAGIKIIKAQSNLQ